jgi:uncharacterized protein (DUF952 family)
VNVIYHITKRDDWQNAMPSGTYRGDTLDTEGFIHCSTADQVVRTANKYYRGESGLVLFHIDPERVNAEVKYEASPSDSNDKFPHIYGPLNMDAIVRIVDFPPGTDGTFQMPE